MQKCFSFFKYLQLYRQLGHSDVFENFLEGEVNFKPTYKYNSGTDDWDSRLGLIECKNSFSYSIWNKENHNILYVKVCFIFKSVLFLLTFPPHNLQKLEILKYSTRYSLF